MAAAFAIRIAAFCYSRFAAAARAPMVGDMTPPHRAAELPERIVRRIVFS